MRRPAFSLVIGFSAACFAAPSFAQNVWIVDDNGGAGVDFTDMPAAVNGASEGDLILVRDGLYSEFTVSAKSLTIAADAGHEPFVSELFVGAGSGLQVIRVSDLAAGQEVVLRGLEVGGTFNQGFFHTPAITLTNNAGSVWIEDCELTEGLGGFNIGFTGIAATNCAGVTVSRSTLVAEVSDGSYGNAVEAVGSHVTLWDCTVQGAPGLGGPFVVPAVGGAGVEISGGTLFASGCTIQGGHGGNTTSFASGGPGGDGLSVHGGATARVRDCTLAGGAGGSGTSTTAAPGQPSNVSMGSLVPINGFRRSFELSSPVRSGVDPVTESYGGRPGDLVYLLWSYTGQMPPLFLGIEHGSFVIDITTLDGIAVGTIGATGTLEITIPPLSLVGPSWFGFASQASFFEPGSGFFLSAPSHLTVVGPGS